jgi:hypothetical protein
MFPLILSLSILAPVPKTKGPEVVGGWDKVPRLTAQQLWELHRRGYFFPTTVASVAGVAMSTPYEWGGRMDYWDYYYKGDPSYETPDPDWPKWVRR